MKHTADIYNELKEVTPYLAEIKKVNPFLVPENYFEELNINILKKIEGDLLHTMPATNVSLSGIPEGYFESLAKNILQKIKIEDSENAVKELTQLSPMLRSVRDKNVYTIPEGYFETFPENVLNVAKPQGKVVSIKKKSIVWQTAAAAMFTGAMAIGALLVNNNTSKSNLVTADTKIKSLNVTDALSYKDQQQINKGIADLSDADIVNYLEVTGSNADEEMLATGIREKELPDEKDYLSDENTLQVFLKKIQSNDSQN